MPPALFEPAIPAGERLQSHALDRSATGIGQQTHYRYNNLLGETLHFHAVPLLRVQDSRPVNLLASRQKKKKLRYATGTSRVPRPIHAVCFIQEYINSPKALDVTSKF
jgi:hypothetical protein